LAEIDKNDRLDAILARRLSSGDGARRDNCPSSDVLAAYHDNSISRAERAQIEEHLGDCEFCISELAAISRAERFGNPAAAASRSSAGNWWLSSPFGMAVAASVAVVVIAGLGRDYYQYAVGDLKRQKNLEQTDLAKVPEPAKVVQLPAPSAMVPIPAPAAPMAAGAMLSNRVPMASMAMAARSMQPDAAANANAPAAAPDGQSSGTDGVGPLAPPEVVNDIGWVRAVVEPPGGLVVWRVGTGGRIMRQVDGKPPHLEASGVTTDLNAGSASSPAVCWVVGDNGVILRSIDGLTWEKIPGPTLVNLMGVTARDSEHATIVAVGANSYSTDDGGQSWWADK